MKNIELGVKLLRKSGRDVAMLTFNPFQGLFQRYFAISCNVSMRVELKDDSMGELKHIPQNKVTFYC
ncbi:MAG: hypothetical protein ACREBS_04525 [Nitrososphaerales archaeon]